MSAALPSGFGELDVAVVGMSGRFPGAESVELLWRGLLAGRELTSPVVVEEAKAPRHVKLTGAPRDPLAFDAAFFAISPFEAALMDPQHRIFLECCYNAIEDAGYAPGRLDGLVGLYASEYLNTYLLSRVFPYLQATGRLDVLQAQIGNEKDHLGTLAAFKLGLSGPVVGVQTACSSSLVAVHLACDALTTYQCDMALAGGVTLSLWNLDGYDPAGGVLVSQDGHCRALDEAASGTVYSNGAGVVVLRRLADALAAGDRVYAVIKGSAVNNDARDRVGYAAPSVKGQIEVLRRALANAAVEPAGLRFVECHGTGTPLGDDIELEALHEVFRGTPPRSCALAAIKANLGHLGVAAGVVGLIKASLALYHRTVPPQILSEQPRGRLREPSSPFFIAAEAHGLPDRGPVHAGVSSFGLGGTNVHVVLQTAPEPAVQPVRHGSGPLVFPFSATSPLSLRLQAQQVADAVGELPDGQLAGAAATLQHRRDELGVRFALVARDADELRAALADAPRAAATAAHAGEPKLIFLLPSGDEGAEAAMRLLDRTSHPVVTAAGRLRQRLRQTGGKPAPGAVLDLFVFQAALAEVLSQRGVQPSLAVGRGLGEVAALYTAGTLGLETCRALLSAVTAEAPTSSHEATAALVAAYRQHSEGSLRPEAGSPAGSFAVHGPLADAVFGRATAATNASVPADGTAAADQRLLLKLAADPTSLLFELGAGGDFSALYATHRSQLAGLRFQAVAADDPRTSFERAVAAAWSAGRRVVWPSQEGTPQPFVALPGYAFDRRHYEILPGGETVAGRRPGDGAARSVEEVLRDLWFEYLGAERPEGEDNLFEHGADSLAVASLANTLSRLFEIDVAMADLYATPGFDDQVRLVQARIEGAPAVAAVAAR